MRMMREPETRLGTVFSLSLTALFAVMLAAGAAATFLTFGKSAANAARQESRTIFSAWARQFETEVATIGRETVGIARMGTALAVDGRLPPQRSTVEAYLLSAAEGMRDIVGCGLWFDPAYRDPAGSRLGLYVFRTTGESRITREFETDAYAYETKSWYRQGLDRDPALGPSVSEPSEELIAGLPVRFITFAFPIIDTQDGRRIGVATVDWSIDTVAASLNGLTYKQGTGLALLYATTGTMAYATPIFGSPDPSDPGLAQVLQVAARVETDVIRDLHKESPSPEGGSRAYARKIGSGFLFAMTLRESDLYADINKIGGLYAGLSTLLLAALGTVAYVFIDRIVVRRVSRLEEDIASVGAGEYELAAIPDWSDELGRIGRSIAAMAAHIGQRERLIEELRSYLRGAIESIPEALAVLSRTGALKLWNPAFQSTFMPEQELAPGRDMLEAIPSLAPYRNIVTAVADGGDPVDLYRENIASSPWRSVQRPLRPAALAGYDRLPDPFRRSVGN